MSSDGTRTASLRQLVTNRSGTVGIGALTLENGEHLPDVEIAVECWGSPNAKGDNIVLVEHALTANAHVSRHVPADASGWWDGLIGPGAPLDTDEWCVLAANVLGGCDGTTGPGSPAPDGRPWGSRFPRVSIRDQVHAELALADRLGIDRFAAVVGGSMGGMRVLEWILAAPQRVRAALVLAVGARATADQIGTQSTQIAAIEADPDWQGGDYYETGRTPAAGLGVARRVAHLSYRTAIDLDQRFENRPQADEDPIRGGRYAVQSYLDHQAGKLVDRFDAGSYVVLTAAMSGHDIGRGRGGVRTALGSVTVPVVVGGVESDRLYPLRTQRELADALPGCAGLDVIESNDGHDGFLTEKAAVGALLRKTLALARETQ